MDQPGSLPDAVDMLGILSGGSEVDASQMSQDLVNPSAALAVSDTFLVPESEPQPTDGSAPSVDYGRDRQDPRNSQLLGPSQSTDVVAATDLDAGTSQGQAAQPSSVADASPDADADDDAGAYPGSVAADADADATQPPSQWDSGDRGHPALDGSAAASDVQGGAAAAAAAVDGTDADADADAYGVGGSAVDGSEDIVGSAAGAGGGGGGGSMRFLDSQARDSFMRHLPLGSEPEGASLGLHAPWTESEAQEGAPGWGPEGFEGSEPLEDGSGLGAVGAGSEGPGAGTEGPVEGGTEGTEAAMSEDVVAGAGAAEALGSEAQPSALASGAGGGSAGPGATAGGSEPLTGAGLTHPPGTGVGSVPSGWGSYGGGAGGPGAGAGGSGGGGGGGGDDFGFEDDLEDYLAAQNQDPRQSYDDIMDYDDVMAELDEQPAGPGGGRSQSTVQQRSAAAAAATAGTNAAAAGPGPKRQRTEAGAAVPLRRGVPTMEELFGDDVEDVVGADVRPGAGQQGGRNQRPGGAPAAGQGQEEGEEGEEEAPAPLPARPYFPPQRMAANVTGGLAFPVTAVSGERVYCRLEDPPPSDAGISGAGAPAAAATAGSGRRRGGRSRDCLLDQPLPELLRILEERQLRAAVEVSELEELRRRQWADGGGAGGSGSGGGGMEGGEGEEGLTEEERAFAGMGPAGPAPWETPGGGAAAALAAEGRRRRRRSSAAGPGPDGSGSQLWVDKYAPRHFLSLLSDERTNREVALWVKDWDDTVFGRTVGAGGPTQGANKPRPAGPRKDTRPANKVILIGGPPGLGKTTLAHVVARHCGYHPYEINASDDRTAAALSTKISDAVQMTAVLGGGRPNLVIVDEIDGATGGSETGGAVAALLKLVRAGEGAAGGTNAAKPSKGAQDADSDGEDEAGEDGAGKRGGGAGGRKGGKGRGSGSLRPLCRPIICICNDLYAPALRPLRDVARVFQFAPPPSERLGGRLGQICAAEGLAAEPAALRLLVERTDRDVRACLNTLQFLARRARRGAGGKRTIEAADIEALNIASKDTTQSAMDMWGLLLSTANTGASRLRNTNSAAGRKRPLGGPGGAGGAGGGGEVVEVCNRLQDFGDYDLVLNGLHENLPRVRFMDVNLGRTAAAAEAMALADQLLRHCRRSGDFGTLRYVPPCLAKVRSLAAQSDRPRGLTWPRLGAEAARRASAAAQLVRSWASGTAGGGSGPAAVAADPSVLAAHGASNMLLEVAPALRALVSAPQLRAVAPHMMSPEEQAALRRAAGLMLHYGLRYALEPHPPPGLAPLQLPEVAATNSNAIILGITTEVQQGIQAGAGGQGGAAGGRGPGGWQRGPGQAQGQQPWGANGWSGGRGGRGGPGGPGGRGPYTNAPGRGYGGGGGGPGRGYGGGAGGGAAPSPAAAAAAAAAVRPVPLSPPIDTLHVYTAFAGAAAAGARTTVPHVVRQMISQATETEAIRRQAEARAAQWGEPAAAPTAAPAAAPADAGPQPLRPMAPPQLRQMAGRMPPGAGGKKSAAAGPEAGAKRKGVTWMDAFKQQASAKARGGGAARPAAAAGAEGAAAAAGAEGGAAGAAAGGGAGAGQQGGKLSFTVLYRFNEGYTNAVKRPLLVRELM